MKIQEIAEEVVKLIRAGKNKEAKDTFYADDIISIEGNGYRLEGIDAIHQKEHSLDGATFRSTFCFCFRTTHSIRSLCDPH